LPRTLLDAFTVTRELGFQYLWVDALCILQGQDDVARADWATESSQMANIYANAHITISASCASQCSDGFLQQRHTTIPCLIRNIKKKDIALDGCLTLWPSLVDLNREPINHRAWTLQEHILAARLLSFTRAFMFWRCGKFLGCEALDYFDPHDLFSISTPRFGPAGRYFPDWSEVVTNFSSRHLTNPDDKLPALSGLARLYHQIRGGRYLAGLWDVTVGEDLLWEAEHFSLFPTNFNRKPHIKPSVPVSYRAPSWSWASMDGSISYRRSSRDFRSLVSLVNWKIDLINPKDAFGQVGAGYLWLSGPMLPVRIKENQSRVYRVQEGKEETHIENVMQDLFALDDIQKDKIGDALFDQSFPKDLRLYCLLVLQKLNDQGEPITDEGLVLSPVGGLDEFRRVGMFSIEGHAKIWFEKACMITVRIV
jgi:hypothetical protein